MLVRYIVGIILLPLLIVVLFFAPQVVLPYAIAAIAALGAYELLWATGFVKHRFMVGVSMAMAVFMPLWFYYQLSPVVLAAVVFGFVVLLFAAGMLTVRPDYGDASVKVMGLGQIGAALFAALVVPSFLSAIQIIAHGPFGVELCLLPFCIAFGCDILAYQVGVVLGKHRLAPLISPKKSVEGSIGGLLGAMLFAGILGMVLKVVYFHDIDFVWLLVVALFGGAVGQFGDLCFSYIKRSFGIKDYSRLLPGHGGALDRFDSIIFVAPYVALMLQIAPVVIK